MPSTGDSLRFAHAYCRRVAESHYENFTVVSRLFPRPLRQHLANVYTYARQADDYADEGSSSARSLALLDWWQEQLDGLYAGRPPQHPVFAALGGTVRAFCLPRQPFADLLTAFRRDQVQKRYATFSELLSYCKCSANPVGRIVLHLGRAFSDENAVLSDKICTGLQLANFCQDVRRDYAMGRIYLPQDECLAHGWDEARFAAGRTDDAFRQLLKAQVDRAEALLRDGLPLVRRAGPHLKLPVRLFAEGGLAILAAIRRRRYDVWSRRPTVGRLTKLRLLLSAWYSG